MEQQKYYPNLDLLKWICSLCVVAIHAAPLHRIAPVTDTFLTGVIFRVAVSLFFSLSGFGFFRKLIFENGKIKNCPENRRRLRRYLGSISLLYICWSIVYFLYQLPGWYAIGWWGWVLMKDCIAALLFQGIYYHMWYLLAVLYAVPVLYWLLSVLPRKQMPYLMALLWLLECAVGSYAWVGAKPILEQIPYFYLLDGPIHALLRTVPLLYVGLCTADVQAGRIRSYKKLTIISAAALLLEASVLYFSGANQNDLAFLFSTPVLVYGIISCALTVPQFSDQPLAGILKKSSVVIYCVHPLVLQLCNAAFAADPLVLWIVCTVISAAIGFAYAVFSSRTRSAAK